MKRWNKLIIGILGIAMCSANGDEKLISHELGSEVDVKAIEKRLEENIDSLALPFLREKELLKQYVDSELGRYVLKNRGLNGYWTSRIILEEHHPKEKNELEELIYNKSPVVLATRERFYIFLEEVQKRVQSNMHFASLPCGLMDDLLRIDYSGVENVSLEGIDLDEESLDLARENANHFGLEKQCAFLKKDGWHLGIENKYDLLISNGLNIYVKEDDKVIELYKQFFVALKPGGELITSFLTPPPTVSEESAWRDFNMEHVMIQKALFVDIAQTAWSSFRTEAQTRAQLEEAGFEVENVIYDRQGMFPSIIARKPGL